MPAALVKSIAEETGISLVEAEKRWAKAKDITLSETDFTESDGDKFWAYVTGVFKKSMGITESAILEAGTAYMQRLSGSEMVMPAQDNLQWVLNRKINYMDAMYRSDLGWIAFLWGREGSRSSDYMDGWGIANILAKDAHNPNTEETLMQAVEALARGRIKRKYGPHGNRRVEILWQGFVARLAWHRGRKTWYLAGWPGLVAEDPGEEQVTESAKIDREANKAAASPTNNEPEPTEAQKESGNYKKGHVKILGLDIAIENPKGSERSGVDKNGKKWTSKINHHYGYIKGTVGRDKDHIDVFLGPDPEGADKVFVVNQVNPETGKFDEHKCLIGFENEKEAKAAYLSNYETGWKGLGSICTLFIDEFKDWLKNGDTKKAVERGEVGTYRVDPILEDTSRSWIGVDLDGTLATYEGYAGPGVIGEPVTLMVDFVKSLLGEGKTVKIFTSRAQDPEAIPTIRQWLGQVGLPDLEITNIKDPYMVMLYDDRAAKVIQNTGVIVEAAEVRTPLTEAENIQRGTEAMKRVISMHVNEPRAMFRQGLGWIAFYWGEKGERPPVFDSNEGMLQWWQGLKNKLGLFSKGYGISHIIAKRDWEGQFIRPLLGQKGKDVAIKLVDVIARGHITGSGQRVNVILGGYEASLDRKYFGRDMIWVLTGMRQVEKNDYRLIFESSGEQGFSTMAHVYAHGNFNSHSHVGAEDSFDNKIVPIIESVKLFSWKQAILNAKSVDDIQGVFGRMFPGMPIIYVSQGDSKIAKGVDVALRLPVLDTMNLSIPDEANMEEVITIGRTYYENNLMSAPVAAPAFNGGEVAFDDAGWQYILEKQRTRSEKDVRRRVKLLPKAKAIIEKTPFVDEVRENEGTDGSIRYGLLGRFSDRTVVRVIVEERQVGGKTFLSVFDWDDVSKKVNQSSSPELVSLPESSGVGEAPHDRGFKKTITPGDQKVKHKIPLKQPGEKHSIMGVDAEVVDVQRFEGIDLELYKAGDEGFVRMWDAEAQELITVRRYPNFADAYAKHVRDVEANGGTVPEKAKGKNIMESAILEMAMNPNEVDQSNWETAIETAEDMDEISNVFKFLFRVKTDEGASPYFESTDRSIVIPLDKLVRREAPDPKRVEHAHEYMKAAKEGTGAKRGPIKVLTMGNGKFKVLDGNTTLHALQEMGETKAIVEIEPTLRQPGVNNIEDLYVQAEEAQPLFMEFMNKLGEKTGGKVMVRPGLKSRARVLEKVAADKHGRIDDIKDVLAGTLVFDTVDDVRRAFETVQRLDPVFRIKNRYEKPLPTGYRDILMNVSMPNGHVAELQLNTQTMIDAKEKGIGHKIYDVARQLSPHAEKASGDLKFIARGAVEELSDISRKVYNQTAAASFSRKSLARASANPLASASEITEAFDLILKAISESSILSQVDLSLPPMENVSHESLSKAIGLSSHSKNSTAMSFPPSDDVTENLTEALKGVKHIVGNPATAFLFDNTPVRVQYAIVDVGALKTSHDDSMALSKEYPQEVQPRQRERGDMQLQIKEMANKLNPERMAASPQASTGAPIVGPDLAVESGNGRTMALRHAYKAGPVGGKYREWLIQHSNEFGMTGVDVAAMKQPVLVRMRVGKVADRAQFARDANKDELAQMSPVEIAKMDAQTLTETDLSIFAPSEDGNIGASSNTAFVNRFVQRLGVNESAGYLTADGRPTKQLIDRIQAAIFQKAYQDESVLALVAEETNPDLRNILSGLTFAAKDFVQARAFADDFDGIDIPKHAIAAGRLVRMLKCRKSREENVVIDEILSQKGLFAEIPEGTATFARFIDKHIRSAKRIGRVLQVAADILKDHLSMRDQAALFDKPEPPTEADIIKRAVARVEEEYADKNKSLFESADAESGVEMTKDSILETSVVVPWFAPIKAAQTFQDIVDIFTRFFGVTAQKIKKGLTDYKDDENSDYGLKVKGIKARERINEQAREIIARVDDAGKLTQEEIGILKQYSGKGGLTENSQYEYYTPTHVAEGLWDAMRANGFENGNILDPCTGAGVFSGTKPKGVVMTGCDLDTTGSRIAQLLNPGDMIQNKPFEQLVMETPDETFDGVITNVPFGSARGACAHDDPAYKDEKRIERYFILRALDKIKPGKLACFVVPTNIVGAKGGKWEGFRTAVSKKAEFLGAHKLPSKTFAAQGTDTVVDIVVFKKHPKDLLDKIDRLHTETLRETNVLWDEFIVGMYWQGEGRKFIMGTYVPKVEGDRWSRETVDGDVDNESLKRKLAMRFNSRIDWDALEAAEPVVKNYAEGARRVINGEEYEMQAGDWVKVLRAETTDQMVLEAAKYGATSYGELESILASPKGALRLTADQAFAVWKAFPTLLSPLQAKAIEFAMSQTKDEYREQLWRGAIIGGMIGRLKAAETEDDPDNDAASMRQDIQDLVTSEISKYGHPKNNKGLVLTGESSRMFGLFTNAMDETGQFSALLAGQLVNDNLGFDATDIPSIVSHLLLREGIQNIELGDVQKLYSGKRKIESLGDIAEIDGVAVTPDGMIMPMGRYCSGDIYPKMQAMTQAMAYETDLRITAKYQKQIDHIMQRRKTTAAPDINFGLQQKWFSRKYIVDFLKENGYPRIYYGVLRDVETEDAVSGAVTTETKFVEDYDDPFGQFGGYDDASGWLKQLNGYLNGKNVTSSKKENKELYQKNARALEDQFNVWMQQHQDIDQLTEKYNQKFNGYLEYEYGGEDLKLEGVSPQVKLHDYQAAAVQRLSEEGRGILAHDVGLGKTYSAMALYAYNKQMGRSKKTCIVVPNAVLSNWYHSSKKFLGNHNGVLTVGFKPKVDKDGDIVQEVVKDEKGQPKKNKHTDELEYQDALIRTDSKEEVWEDMWKIPQGNYSLVIMTKEKFGTIPMRPSTKRGFADKMVARALISEKQAEATVNENSQGGSVDRTAGTTYQGDKDRLNLEQKYSDEGTRKKGELPFFEDMGFTDVIVDEVHEFKNSFEGGENTKNIAYLPTAPSAKRALDMAMKMSHLREANNGRGPYLLSATPVTNSPFEIYNILSLCCPIEEFERFGVYTVDDFVRVFGRIELVDKVKVSGEVATMDGLTGFQNLDGLRTLFHKYTNMKNAKDVNLPLPPHDEHQDMVELTEEQQGVYESLRWRAKEAAKPGSTESMFAVMRDMDRVTTDMDLYRHTMTFHFPAKHKAKVDALIGKLPDEITTTIREEGESVTQQIPLDHKTRMDGDTYILIVPEAYEELVVAKFPEMGIDETEVGHPVTPKYAKLIERLRKHFEEEGKQLIFTEEKSQHEKIRRLIVHEVPVWKDVIGVINADTANGSKLQQISDLYNSGSLKIIVANKKAEVGVNLQNGTTAIHHLTLPWTPASIQQRNGRGVRQGNMAEHVDIYYYLGKGSFDQYRLDLLQKKSNWMNDLFKGTETTAENANAFQADEYVDMLESDPEEAKKRRMEKLAKKAAERKAREDLISANMLQQLANNTHILGNLDAEKERVREDLEKKIPEYETKLTNYEKRITDATDPEQKDLLRQRAEAAQKALRNYQVRLKGLDESYAAKRTELEARNKQNSGVLRFRAKKEGLPFDEALIDHPENAVVSLSGVVIAKGAFYEVIKADGEDHAASRLRRAYGGRLIQVTKVNPVEKWLQFENVIGGYVNIPSEYKDGRRVTPINLWPVKDLKQVSYSADEMALKKILANSFDYEDLVKGEISKDIFYDHINEIAFNSYSYCVFRTPNGFGFAQFQDIENRKSIVYPELQNEDFRKGVCEAFLALNRKGSANRYVLAFMKALFGNDWHDIAMAYGKMGTESEIRAAVAVAYAAAEKAFEPYEDPIVNLEQKIFQIVRMKAGDIQHEAIAALGAIDNVADVSPIVSEFLNTKSDEWQAELGRLKEEKKRQELEDLKNDPNYKEVPSNIAKAFQDIGITVKTNMTHMVIPEFKGRKGMPVEPFAKWYFQDGNGKDGRLFRTKDILKARFRASFFQDAGDGFRGAWWHVPSSANLEDIYKLLA